ncbi:MAG: arginine--tRNA ligase, partial [Clostridiales bacterium]|nr:arginine--tRNA ligase [Clostridiales bacterium]
PYLIYTYARTRSILRKGAEKGILPSDSDSLKILTGDDEYAVIRALADFQESIVKAASSNEPFMIARQVALIARAHNRFYNNSSILGCEDSDLRLARLSLCEAVCTAIKEGLDLLGIGCVERM